MLASSAPISRPRPPSQTRRPTGMSPAASPARLRTQSQATHRQPPPTEPEAPPPYTKENPAPNPRHSLTEIDDMLNVAGSVVRNRERELDAAALASRSLLEENKLMFAKRDALLARLPISPRTSISAPVDRHPTNRSSSWSTCSDDSDMDTATSTPCRDVSTPTPGDPLEPHRIVTPTHSAASSVDLGSTAPSPPQPPAARLAPTQAERIAALHAGLATPTPAHPRPTSASARRVSVSPAAVNHLQEANSALLARVQELEEATAKAHTEGAARMRRLQAEAESLRQRLGEAEKANEGLRTEAEREKEKHRARAQSAGARQHRKQANVEDKEEPVPSVPTDFAPGATWRPEFRSLRGGVRPARAATATAATAATVSRGSRVGPARAQSSAAAPSSTPTARRMSPPSTPARPARAQSNAIPLRNQPVSPLKHTPLRPSRLRHQRANSYAGLGKSFQSALDAAAGEMGRVVSTVVEEGMSDMEGASPGPASSPRMSPIETTSPMDLEVRPSPTQLSAGVLPFPSVGDKEDMSPVSTRLLAQELVAKINELSATNEEILHQRDHLKDMLEAAEAEAEELKRVCERLEHEVEVERSGGESEGRKRSGSEGEGRVSSGEGHKRPGSARGLLPGLQLEIPALGLGDLDGESAPGPAWTGSVRGRKQGGALQELAAELGAELQDDTDVDGGCAQVDLASELLMAGSGSGGSKPTTPTKTSFGSLGQGHPNAPLPRSHQVSSASTKRALGGRGLATRAKTNPRRVRKSLSSVVFASGGKALPSPVSSPTTASAAGAPSVGETEVDSPMTPVRNKNPEDEFVTSRSEFVTSREMVTPPHQQEVYLTPASTLRIPGSLPRAFTAPSPMTDDDDLASPSRPRNGDNSTMAQLRAALDPLFNGVVQGHCGPSTGPDDKSLPIVRRKASNIRLVFSKDEPLEPWEAKIRDLYSEIRAFEQEDPGMSSAGEDARRGSRRARALGRMSLRRRATGLSGADNDGVSDYAADDSEVGDATVRRAAQEQEEQQKRAAGFELARKLQQRSMSTFLEVLLLVQFAVVLIVFVYTAVRRGPKAVLGVKRTTGGQR